MTSLTSSPPTATASSGVEPRIVPGRHRVRAVWLSPSLDQPSGGQAPGVPTSEGRWIQRHPQVYARHAVAVPVTVGVPLTLAAHPRIV